MRQWTGINAIMFYVPVIFNSLGKGKSAVRALGKRGTPLSVWAHGAALSAKRALREGCTLGRAPPPLLAAAWPAQAHIAALCPLCPLPAVPAQHSDHWRRQRGG